MTVKPKNIIEQKEPVSIFYRKMIFFLLHVIRQNEYFISNESV